LKVRKRTVQEILGREIRMSSRR